MEKSAYGHRYIRSEFTGVPIDQNFEAVKKILKNELRRKAAKDKRTNGRNRKTQTTD